MKKIALTLFCFINVLSYGQEANKALIHWQAVDQFRTQTTQGKLEFMHKRKALTDRDTVMSFYQAYFIKSLDSSKTLRTHYSYINQNARFKGGVIYNGSEFIQYNLSDSTGLRFDEARWTERARRNSQDKLPYPIITSTTSLEVHKIDELDLNNKVLIDHGKEFINGRNTIHIELSQSIEPDLDQFMKVIEIECHVWVSEEDSVPLQYSIEYVAVMNGDTLHQYDLYTLLAYDLEEITELEITGTLSAPENIALEDYREKDLTPPLEVGMRIPVLKATLLNGDSFDLSDQNEKLILLDFFYFSCYPCMLAMPELQALYENYKDKGLLIVGLDPYDLTKQEELRIALNKQGINYPIAMINKEIARSFHVSSYPTLYLINSQGEVVFTKVGYTRGLDQLLEQEIIKWLN